MQAAGINRPLVPCLSQNLLLRLNIPEPPRSVETDAQQEMLQEHNLADPVLVAFEDH